MTRTTPWRWITLHLSHNFFTDARTFIVLSFQSHTKQPPGTHQGRDKTHGPFSVTATMCSK